MQNNKREFILVSKKDEAIDVVSLYFNTVDGVKYEFIAGQFVEIKPPRLTGHGKSYTISSTPDDELIRITIKRKGAVSSAIIDLNIGDQIEFEGPYGVFYPDETMKDIVMLAGGVGITPFISVIKDNIDKQNDIKMTLFYSNKTLGDVTFFDELNELCEKTPNLTVVNCLTQDEKPYKNIDEHQRINKDVINKYLTLIDGKNFYICGSISFVADMWRMLKGIGVDEECIYTESFY